jgi:DNA-binding CsgD family transcriptional regulator
VLIEGPAGIGKTALLAAVRSQAHGAGMVVARARGTELESGFAFGVVRQLFEPLLRACTPRETTRLFRGAAALARDVVGPDGREMSVARDRLLGVLHGLYWLALNLAERGPLLAAIDDAHWGDRASLRFLSYLAGRLDGTALLAVAAVRETDDEALAAAAREPTTRTVRLKPLAVAASAQLLQAEFPEAVAPEFADACQEATRGNPFYLCELIRALRADGIAPTALQACQVAEQGPTTVARSVLTRIAALPPACAAVTRALAVLGGEAGVREIAELSALDVTIVAVALDSLVAAEIIAGTDPVTFIHPIVRTSIYADMPPSERARAHLQAARLLADSGAPAERVALHLLPVRVAGDAWRVSVLSEAARGALARGAPDSAVAYLTAALAELPASKDRHDLVALLGRAEYLALQPGAAAHLTEAMATAPTATRRGEIALDAARALIMAEPDRSEAAIEVLDRTIREIARPGSQLSMRLEAHLLAAAGLKLSTRPTHLRRLDEVHSRSLGDDPADRLLLANLAFWTLIDGRTRGRFQQLARRGDRPGSPADIARQVAERAIADGRLLDEEGSDSELLYFAIVTLYLAGSLDRAEVWLKAVIDHARERGSLRGYALASAVLADVTYQRGDLRAAEAHARAAAEIEPEDAVAVLVHVLIELGRLREADDLLEPRWLAADADHLLLQPIRIANARLRIAQRQADEASNQLLICADWLQRWGACNPGRFPWRSTTAFALVDLGQHDQARGLAEEEVALARALGEPCALGVALRALGLVEQGADGIDLLREAHLELERSEARLEHARALVDYGAAIRRRGHRVDARVPLRTGLDLAHRCGATVLAQRARQELLATGARPRRAVLTGRDALTPTEARVAQMAAEGQSTPEIAQALFVTPKTIETHLGHVYQKLEVHARGDLARALGQPLTTT